MSLHFGYNDQRDQTKISLHYNFIYPALTTKNAYYTHKELIFGHPVPLIYCGSINTNTNLTILAHIFDRDSTITTLKIMYALEFIKRDGTSVIVDVKEIDMLTKKIKPKQIFLLNEICNISDLYSDYDQVVFIKMKIKRTSNTSYGNESNLDVVIEY